MPTKVNIRLAVTREAIGGIDREYMLRGEPLHAHLMSIVGCALGGKCRGQSLIDDTDLRFSVSNGGGSDISGEYDAYIFASPFAFTLPDNVFFDSAVSVASPYGAVAVHGVTPVYAVDAVVVGSAEIPTAVFIRGSVARELIHGEPAMLRELTELLKAAPTTHAKRRDSAGKTISVRKISCGEPLRSRAAFFGAAEDYRRDCINAVIDGGVDIPCPSGVIIAPSAAIGEGTQLGPNTEIGAGAVIGRNCVITANSVVKNSVVGDGCIIVSSYITDASLPAGTSTAPFSVISGGRGAGTDAARNTDTGVPQ